MNRIIGRFIAILSAALCIHSLNAYANSECDAAISVKSYGKILDSAWKIKFAVDVSPISPVKLENCKTSKGSFVFTQMLVKEGSPDSTEDRSEAWIEHNTNSFEINSEQNIPPPWILDDVTDIRDVKCTCF